MTAESGDALCATPDSNFQTARREHLLVATVVKIRSRADTISRSRGAMRPSFGSRPALTIERACGTPGARCTLARTPMPSSAREVRPRGRIHRNHPAFRTRWCYGLLRGTPDDRSTGFPSPFQERCRRPAPLYEAAIRQRRPNARRCVRMTRLGPSGCRALRQSHNARPPHPRLAIVTIALAPLSEAGCTRTTII
jgi:hypothetical protein